VAALTGPIDFLTERNAVFQERRDLCLNAFNSTLGLSCRRSDGAFYLFSSCVGIIGRRQPNGEIIENDVQFAMYLLESAGVAVVPGSAFGPGDYFRISFASSTDRCVPHARASVKRAVRLNNQRRTKMDLGISGKCALVLGAGGGLGGAIAHTLAAEGAKVVVADIDGDAAAKTADSIRSAGGEAFSIEWDISDLSAIESNVSDIESRYGNVAILVNNTGGPPPTTVSGQPAEQWAKFFQSMILSVIALTDRVLPGMRNTGWGRIITSTSSGIIAPIPNLGLSNALRSVLVGWSKTLAKEVGGDGITCNIVLPGRIATPRITFLDEQKAKRGGRSIEDVAAESTASIPVGRYGEPQEYGDVVAFLASARASFITGSIIRVDGGMIASI
jgi:3-oxoacyl-[acyl-carrier protein] reductase